VKFSQCFRFFLAFYRADGKPGQTVWNGSSRSRCMNGFSGCSRKAKFFKNATLAVSFAAVCIECLQSLLRRQSQSNHFIASGSDDRRSIEKQL
jgi:hypothetical protein